MGSQPRYRVVTSIRIPRVPPRPTPVRLGTATAFLCMLWSPSPFGRSFVWIDDEITDVDRRWVSAHQPSRALLHRVDPHIGRTDADFVHISRWLAGG